jgi:thiosulfate/3-mercaptopyruvate sulfurtransferase
MIPAVVDVAWWRKNRLQVVLCDVRWYLDGRSGRFAYDRGHLPGAVFVDLDSLLSGPPSPADGRHPLPDPARFAEGMAQLGIADGTTVIAYDDGGGVVAARLVWMLRVTGHEAALLDGGIQAYTGPKQMDHPSRHRAPFTPRPWPTAGIAGIDDATSGDSVVIDARPWERYLGGSPDPIDVRSGHIPGARSLPCRENLDAEGRLLSADELRRRFAAVGITPGTPVVSYCGSGVTACHNLLAMELAGLGSGRLYPGSWSQYALATDWPIETGDAST